MNEHGVLYFDFVVNKSVEIYVDEKISQFFVAVILCRKLFFNTFYYECASRSRFSYHYQLDESDLWFVVYFGKIVTLTLLTFCLLLHRRPDS